MINSLHCILKNILFCPLRGQEFHVWQTIFLKLAEIHTPTIDHMKAPIFSFFNGRNKGMASIEGATPSIIKKLFFTGRRNSDVKWRFMYQKRPSKLHLLPFDQGSKYLFLQDLRQVYQKQSKRHLTVFWINPNDLGLLFIMLMVHLSYYHALVLLAHKSWVMGLSNEELLFTVLPIRANKASSQTWNQFLTLGAGV